MSETEFQRDAFYSVLRKHECNLRAAQTESFRCVESIKAGDMETAAATMSAYQENNDSPVVAAIRRALGQIRQSRNHNAEVAQAATDLLGFAKAVGSKINDYMAVISNLWGFLSIIVQGYSNNLSIMAKELDVSFDTKHRYSLKARIIRKSEKIPNGWHMMSVDEAIQWKGKWKTAMRSPWSICLIKNGKVDGAGYGYKITHGSHEFENYVGERLVCKYYRKPEPLSSLAMTFIRQKLLPQRISEVTKLKELEPYQKQIGGGASSASIDKLKK